MPKIQRLPELRFLSELYVRDAPDAVLLTEYPSSNSEETQFRNRSKYIIHDPFPPPSRELMKVLGPHHLMCGWGRSLAVTSEVPPPPELIEHWLGIFGDEGCPIWQPCPLESDGTASSRVDQRTQYIAIFPHESLSPHQQVIDPDTNYSIHSKEVIADIDCPQAAVLPHIVPPCIVKVSHGYAGLGNFIISRPEDETLMFNHLGKHWPRATLVVNKIIEGITGDFGVQFYLSKDGAMIWLGLTEQHFDSTKKWCGGTFSAELQNQLFDSLCEFVEPVGDHLHKCGYFGLVGIDVLKDSTNRFFLVDVNPRLTGITPFLMASRIFSLDEGLSEGVYRAGFQFAGSMEQLMEEANRVVDAKVVILSAVQQAMGTKDVTTCHIAVSSDSQARNQQVFSRLS